MTKPDTAVPDAVISGTTILDCGLQKQAGRFLGDFAAFAGMEGVWGAVLAIAGAVFESVGIWPASICKFSAAIFQSYVNSPRSGGPEAREPSA